MSEASLPRVLSVYEGFFSGGARILHTDMVVGLQEQGYPQSVISINESIRREAVLQDMRQDASYMRLASRGINVASLGRCAEGTAGSADFSELELRQFQREAETADVILSLKEQPLRLINQADMVDTPVVTCLHRSDPENQDTVFEVLMDAVSDERVVACICCADSTKAAYQQAGIPESKLHVITNGIDLDKFRVCETARQGTREALQIPDDAPVVILAARFDSLKNIPLFLESASAYLTSQTDAHVVMCGAGMNEQNPALKQLVENLFGSSPQQLSRIHALGIQRNMPSLYAAADIVALTSAVEAYPLCLIEGMACGAVPVTTDVGDTSNIVKDSGLITGTDPELIAEAWQQAYEQRNKFREAYLRVKEDYSRRHMVSAYAEFIAQLLEPATQIRLAEVSTG